jgi:hypothetical protein
MSKLPISFNHCTIVLLFALLFSVVDVGQVFASPYTISFSGTFGIDSNHWVVGTPTPDYASFSSQAFSGYITFDDQFPGGETLYTTQHLGYTVSSAQMTCNGVTLNMSGDSSWINVNSGQYESYGATLNGFTVSKGYNAESSLFFTRSSSDPSFLTNLNLLQPSDALQSAAYKSFTLKYYVYPNGSTIDNGFGYSDSYYLFGLIDSVTTNANPSAVPIPGAVWLLGSGLLGLIGFKKKA